jgi:hypothetical protein
MNPAAAFRKNEVYAARWRALLGRLIVRVRRGECEVEEEWRLGVVGFDQADGIVAQEGRYIALFLDRDVVAKPVPGAVSGMGDGTGSPFWGRKGRAQRGMRRPGRNRHFEGGKHRDGAEARQPRSSGQGRSSLPHGGYPRLNASIGSTRAARRAGSQVATNAARPNKATITR